MGFIENNKAACMLSVLINTHLLMARARGRSRALLLRLSRHASTRRQQQDSPRSSPAGGRRLSGDARGRLRLGEALQRADVPALLRGLRSRDPSRPLPQRLWAARHLDGGREKAPAAICRKVAEAALTGDREIEIWGDGQQTRSFMYIDDCVTGTLMIAERTSPPDQPRQLRARHDQRAGRHRRGHRRDQARRVATTSTRRRASAAATVTTP